jgi:hypothetical protein
VFVLLGRVGATLAAGAGEGTGKAVVASCALSATSTATGGTETPAQLVLNSSAERIVSRFKSIAPSPEPRDQVLGAQVRVPLQHPQLFVSADGGDLHEAESALEQPTNRFVS